MNTHMGRLSLGKGFFYIWHSKDNTLMVRTWSQLPGGGVRITRPSCVVCPACAHLPFPQPYLWEALLPLSLRSLKPPCSHLKVVRTIAGVLAKVCSCSLCLSFSCFITCILPLYFHYLTFSLLPPSFFSLPLLFSPPISLPCLPRSDTHWR